MRNHYEKYKDMAESVLPSKQRRSARQDRRAIHQRHRAQTRAALADYRVAGDPVDVETDMRGTPDREIRDFVWDRRSADKVGPLIRWAIRRVERDPRLRDADVATQVAAFRSVFPDNLIGRHALDHIKWALSWNANRDPDLRPRADRRNDDLEALRAQVRTILENGRHRELNGGIRRRGSRRRRLRRNGQPWQHDWLHGQAASL
ncbi:MAG TPA: hypothetical protein VHC43_10570 [Mycobacteriales bacterium]|nr:hypothetical protein [Mycobacteriales bacterium]